MTQQTIFIIIIIFGPATDKLFIYLFKHLFLSCNTPFPPKGCKGSKGLKAR